MSRYSKAIIATLTALGTWGVTAYADDAITSVELFGLCGVVVAGLTVFTIPNTPPTGQPRDPHMSETVPEGLPHDDLPTTGSPEAGQSVAVVAAVSAVVCLVLLFAFDLI